MKYNYIILLFSLICVSASAQSKQIGIQLDKMQVVADKPSFTLPFSFQAKNNQSLMLSQPKVYAYKDLAFFCKMEVLIEQSAKVPFKFRLGSVDYVDRLEQKRRSY